MNPNIDLLAFLYAIAAENINDSALDKLGIQLHCKPINWQAVQNKLDDIFNKYPTLQDIYNNYQTQLYTKDKESLLDLLPTEEKLNQNSEVISRSLKPGSDDPVTIEITNTAVVILQSDNPPEKSNELLNPLNEILQEEQGNN